MSGRTAVCVMLGGVAYLLAGFAVSAWLIQTRRTRKIATYMGMSAVDFGFSAFTMMCWPAVIVILRKLARAARKEQGESGG